MYRVLATIIDLNSNMDMVSPGKYRVPINSLVDYIMQSLKGIMMVSGRYNS